MSLVSIFTKLGAPPESTTKKPSDAETEKKVKTRRTLKPQALGKLDLGSEEEFYDALDDMRVGDERASKGGPSDDEDIDTLGLIGKFTIDKIVVFISKAVDEVEDMAISLMAEGVSLELTASDTLTEVNFRLGGIGIREHFSSSDGFLLVDAQTEAESKDLLQVNLQLVKPTRLLNFQPHMGRSSVPSPLPCPRSRSLSSRTIHSKLQSLFCNEFCLRWRWDSPLRRPRPLQNLPLLRD